MMDTHSLKNLEYYKILEVLSFFAKTFEGKKKIKNINPEIDYTIAKTKLQEVTELKKYIQIEGHVPIGQIEESDILEKINKCLCLLPEEIIYIAHILRISMDIDKYFVNLNENGFSTLLFWKKNFEPLCDLENKIKHTIDNNGEVKNEASLRLSGIKRGILDTNTEIKKQLTELMYSSRYQKFIQDTIITVRNRRFVVPVKHENQTEIAGIIQDESASHATVFIEPFEIVEKNNRLQELYFQEKQEINNILHNLTLQINKVHTKIVKNFNLISNLDVINAKCILSQKLQAIEPELNTSGIVKIVNGRHPLLLLGDNSNATPVSVSVGENFNVLLLSGANAGGKTATLKMTGLLVLMAQSGFHIPCGEGTSVGIFNQVWAEIGDEQSLEKNLSTFSSHIMYIKSIIDNLVPKALVLLDEICADTDPEEGACLAFSIIKFLSEREIRVVATTHFHFLKLLALSEEKMLNASVEFDGKTLKPTYRILMGNLGASETLLLAGKFGLPEIIIENAVKIKINKASKIDTLIGILQEKRAELEKEKNMIENERKKLFFLSSSAQQKLNLLNNELENYQNKYNKDFKKMTKELKQKLQDIISRAREINRKEDALKILKEFESTKDEYDEKLKKSPPDGIEYENKGLSFNDIEIGDRIKIMDSEQVGEVIGKEEKDYTIIVKVKNIKLKVAPVNLKKVLTDKNINEKRADNPVTIFFDNSTVENKLNIIGLTGEDARDKIIHFLDHAYIRNINTVEIIHGHGHGILKKLVKDVLAELPFVLNYHYGDTFEGGTGVTIVNFVK